MVERLLTGSKRYYMWLGFLCLLILASFCVYWTQLTEGLGVTGMNRDVSWGLYISQFTYLLVWRRRLLCWCCPLISITIKSLSA